MSWSRTSLKLKTRINDAETLNGTLNSMLEVDSRDFLLCSLLKLRTQEVAKHERSVRA